MQHAQWQLQRNIQNQYARAQHQARRTDFKSKGLWRDVVDVIDLRAHVTSCVQRMLPKKWPRMRMTKHETGAIQILEVPRNICTTAVKHVGTTDDTFQACVVATLQQWYYCSKSNINAKHCGCKAGVAIVQLKHRVTKQARVRRALGLVELHSESVELNFVVFHWICIP